MEASIAITTTDIDGINLLAVQALERRTAELREKAAQVAALEARVAELGASAGGARGDSTQVTIILTEE